MEKALAQVMARGTEAAAGMGMPVLLTAAGQALQYGHG